MIALEPPEPRAADLEIGRPRGRAVDRRRAVVEQEDRLELRPRRAQQREPALDRPAVRPLVRQHRAGRVRLGAQRGDDPAARARDAVRPDEVLLEPPHGRRSRPGRARRRRATPADARRRRRRPARASGARRCAGRARAARPRSSSAITSYGGAVTASVGRAYRTARNGRTSATARAYTHAVATIAELVEDRTVDGVYAVARKRRLTTRGGKPYLALELVDPSGRIEGRVWDDVELLDRRFSEGDAVRVLGRVERFDGRLQLAVRTVEAADDRSGNARAGDPPRRRRARRVPRVPRRGDRPSSAGRARRRDPLATARSERACGCCRRPGADGHHGYAGGLLEHTVGVATLCRETAQLHPRLRSDLLLSAALLHDVGRVARARPRAGVPADAGRRPARARPARACASSTSAPARSIRRCARSCCTRSQRTTTARAARTAEAAVLYHANQLDAVAATRPVGDD